MKPLLQKGSELGRIVQRMRHLNTGPEIARTAFRRMLVAITRRNRDALASLGATARKHGLAALGLHTLPEAVHFGAFAAIGLKCALGHAETALLVDK